MEPTIDELRREREALTARLSKPERLPGEDFARASSRLSELTEILDLADRLKQVQMSITDHEGEIRSDDADLKTIAAQELPTLRAEEQRIRADLDARLTPPESFTGNDAVVEIRAGTGGEEAALFAAELFAMYTKFSATRGWTVSLVSANRSDLGGYREVIAEVQGKGAYGTLRFESGVHRVQRIPATEKAGRIHTSTATVAVLPVAKPTDVEIRPQDLRIDTFRSGGHGGQHVQKTESAVRVTHLPSGLVVICQDERSQHANKERALEVLRSRVLAMQLEQQRRHEQQERRSQIGTGDRSEKIRTYNFPQDRVTDHRTKDSWHGIDRILNGELDPILDALQTAARRTS